MASAHVLLESIFNTAHTIEEAILDQHGRPYPESTRADELKRKLNRIVDVSAAKVKNTASKTASKIGKTARNLAANQKVKGGLIGAGLTGAGIAGGYTLHNKIAGLLAGSDDEGEGEA